MTDKNDSIEKFILDEAYLIKPDNEDYLRVISKNFREPKNCTQTISADLYGSKSQTLIEELENGVK
ncbi:hypothetical protein [Butyrivibrio hungatei]|uniref:Uncharacterized protein n=1 Tax=Butyrivibrio hungatei TaxID=185008 RepID=A0A1D9P5R3_9FIRM|nr:hypothetical protein [Butyrivibrio hungatei]AOZ97879.1 hypothetical protein bhn_II080 [Butyrivibrio hungatei]